MRYTQDQAQKMAEYIRQNADRWKIDDYLYEIVFGAERDEQPDPESDPFCCEDDEDAFCCGYED